MADDKKASVRSISTIDYVTAEKEFDRFVELWEIDGDVETMNEESRDGYDAHKRAICRGIVRGTVTIDDEGAVTIKLPNTTELALPEITLGVPTGAAMLKFDNYKDRQNVHKMNAMLGHMSKQNPAVFAKIDGRDLKPAMAVATLFLAS